MNTQTHKSLDGTTPQKKKLTSTTQILLGIGLGLALGLFFGEAVGGLSIVGEIYIKLLQMTVMPFIVLSLIANIGRFSLAESASLAKVSIAVMLGLWIIGLLTLVVLPISFPDLEAGAFFTASLVEERMPPDFIKLYIPSNPFSSLAQNFVPAVVVFSLLLGVALITVENKKIFLDQADVLIKGLIQVNRFVVSLTPIGVFAITAGAAGTITLSEFGRLQGYLLSHTFGAVLLAFWVLPGVVTLVTPLSYGSILRNSRDFLLTAFVTGSLFAVLPMLIDSIDRMLAEQHWDARDTHATPDVLVPLAYPFPTLGKIISLIFIPFAAWFVGKSIAVTDFINFLVSGLFSSFGSLAVTIPFLLDLLELPTDMFQLFLMAGVWSARVSDLVGGMSLLAFAVIVTLAMGSQLKIQWRRLPAFAGLTALFFATVLVGTRSYLDHAFAGEYSKPDVLSSMQTLNTPGSFEILERAAPNPVPLREGQTVIDRIEEQGVLRVGYNPDRIPFSYSNIEGELVGLDIDMINKLASDLKLDLEFVPYDTARLSEDLAADHFDIAVSGIEGSLVNSRTMTVSAPYMDVSLAGVIRDHERDLFLDLERLVRDQEEYTFAVRANSFFSERLDVVLPRAQKIEIEKDREFFEGKVEADALVTSAEGGSAWTLLYPQFAVLAPVRPSPKTPLVYTMARGSTELKQVLDSWIYLKQRDGTFNRLYRHWILGQKNKGAEHRWSIARDVLGWFK
jgi:Na+/H+-dicarboxylate symporter